MANTREPLFFRKGRGAVIQLAEIRTGGENGLARARNKADGSLGSKRSKCGDKLFQFREHGCANFVGRVMIERQLDHAFAPFPTQRFASKDFHACCLLASSRLPLASYIALISEAYRAFMESRRILPMAVSNPLSGVKTSRTIVKLRICR